MSLLNQVLRDLDKRHASEIERLRVPVHVRPLPPKPAAPAKSRWIVIGIAGALVVATFVWVALRAWHEPPSMQGAVPPAPRQPDADIVAQALDMERQAAATDSVREANGKLSALVSSPAIAVTELPPASPPPVAQPEVAASLPVAKPTVKPAPKTATSPQEASGSIKGAPLAHYNNADDPQGKVDITHKNVNSEVETRRAVNLMERGQRAEAETALRQVLAADASYQPARSAMFRLLAGGGRREEAISLLTEGLRVNASNTQWAMNLARLQAERDDNAAAWETLQRTLPYAQLLPDYRAFCGTVLQRLNRPAEAIDHYRAALRARPDEGRWWVGLGLALEAAGKSTDARDAFMRAQGTGSLPPELATYVEDKLKK